MTQPAHAARVARLLIVDDEPHIRSSFARGLSLLGYDTAEADSGQAALNLLRQQTYDLMVLDMRLPDLNGLDVMLHAHQMSPGLVIIILTGHASLESAIAAVKSEEVVDYLVKPVGVRDMAAAVARALRKRDERLERERLVSAVHTAAEALRQAESLRPSSFGIVLHVAPLKLDCQKRLLTLESAPERSVELTEGETSLLAFLMTRPDEVLSCRELAWAGLAYATEEPEAQLLIRPYIFRLRQKMEAEPGQPRFIRTVRGAGYRLVVGG